MDIFDYIIVGSGPAGVAAALRLAGKKVLLVDVGLRPPEYKSLNLMEAKKNQDVHDILIGQNYSSLSNLDFDYKSPKLKGPLLSYLTEEVEGQKTQYSGTGFIRSFAKGGLANAWGGGVYRFNDQEFKKFPFKYKDIQKFYDIVEAEMGINGCNDDLTDVLFQSNQLEEPIELSKMGSQFFNFYEKNKKQFKKKGFAIGRPRVAINLNSQKREQYKFNGDDFFSPKVDGLYSPSYTLKRLIDQNQVNYLPNTLVHSYEEKEGVVHVFVTDIKSKMKSTLKCKKLLVGAGVLSTAQIILESFKDYDSKLFIQENPITFVPLVNPTMIGKPFEKIQRGGELLLFYNQLNQTEYPIIMTYYSLQAALKSDLWVELPGSIQTKFLALRELVPAMSMIQIFYPGHFHQDNFVKLNKKNELEIQFKNIQTNKKMEAQLMSLLRKGLFIGFSFLNKTPLPGSSIHYGCTFPMGSTQKNGTNEFGKLNRSQNVYVIDSSCFSELPSKNLTMTIMANSMRIADYLAKSEDL